MLERKVLGCPKRPSAHLVILQIRRLSPGRGDGLFTQHHVVLEFLHHCSSN